MSMYLVFSIISVLVYIFWAYSYIKDIFKWKAIPHPFSWIWWTIIISINLYWSFSLSWLSWTILPIFVRLLNVLFWTIAWFILIKKIKIDYFDKLCLFLSISCLAIFYFTWLTEAIFACIIVDMLLLFPTIKKIILNPNSEPITIRITTALMPVFLLLSIENHTLENSLYWIIVIIENVFISWLILYKNNLKK